MRQRITYVLHDPASFTPDALTVRPTSLHVGRLAAAKEHRFSLAYTELPPALQAALKPCQALHLRWASYAAPASSVTPVAPFYARVPSGLHVFYSPRDGDAGADGDTPAEAGPAGGEALCAALKDAWGGEIACSRESFSRVAVQSARFSRTPAWQWYGHVSDLDAVLAFARRTVCAAVPEGDAARLRQCEADVAALRSAAAVNVNYDAVSYSLSVEAFWPEAPGEAGVWEEEIPKLSEIEKVEVGVLNREKAAEPAELSLGGFLTIIGDDDKPKPTLFSFPSRHHPSPSARDAVALAFEQPTGLHPKITLRFPAGVHRPDDTSCALYAYFTLPSFLFVDRYQFTDPLFLDAANLRALHSLAGATDLEAPDYLTPQWGSAALFELRPPPSSAAAADESESESEPWAAEIPLHLRYLRPSPPNATAPGYAPGRLAAPAVFWACRANEGSKFTVNPFDRVNLGYEALFGERTMFYHVPPRAGPAGEGLAEPITVPVLDGNQAQLVEYGTVVAVLLGTCWIVWKLLAGYRRSGIDRPTTTEPTKKSR